MRLSIRAFAGQLGVSSRTIQNWEGAGHAAALRPESQELLDTMLTRAAADAHERFVAMVGGDAVLNHRSVSNDLQHPMNPALTLPTLANQSGREIDLEGFLTNTGDESAAWLPAIEASNVGGSTVEDMHSEVRRIASLYLSVPTMPLFERIRTLRNQAFSLLSGRQHPQQSRELYAVAGWSLTLLAWMTVDFGRPDLAQRHTLTARACAENADHDGLRAWVCATQHTAAFWQDDLHRAAAYAAEGLQYATGSAAMFLASAHALDLARSGQADAARESLAVAKRAAEKPPSGYDDLAGPLACSAERAASLWSDTHLALGEARPALEISDAAMRAFELVPESERNRGSERMVRLLVGRAHLMLDEPDGAADALAPVLQTAPEHRVRPLLRRISEVGELVAAPDRGAMTSTMRDEITEFVRTPPNTPTP
jgi:hypothetical protein